MMLSFLYRMILHHAGPCLEVKRPSKVTVIVRRTALDPSFLIFAALCSCVWHSLGMH